jgi:nucleoside phosphorylase
MSFEVKSAECIADYISQIDFLFITATETETQAVHKAMQPLYTESKIVVIRKNALTYFLGYFGKHRICHVECAMGSVGVGASSLTTQQAIADWRVKAVLMVGIAFGIDSDKQRIGDILLANPIVPYEKKRVGNKEIIPRGHAQAPNPILANYFRHALDWSHNLLTGEQARIYMGPVLSGEVLIDNVNYRDSLLLQYPEAVGGEMEGAGLVSAAYTYQMPWLLMKGICDFADGNKRKNKKENQQEAIASVVSLCLHVFSQEGSLKEFISTPIASHNVFKSNVNHEIKTIVEEVTSKSTLLSLATFNVYTTSVEKYYLNRDLDSEFNGFLNLNKSIWLHGVSGSGKTSLVYRNVLKRLELLHVVDFSGCTLLTGVEVFNYINQQLLDIKGIAKIDFSEKLPAALDELLSTLRQHYKQGDSIAFEEVPVSDSHQEPVKAVIMLLKKYYNLNISNYCRFTITSIPSPRTFLDSSTLKVASQVRFQQVAQWNDADLNKLCLIIEKASGLKLSAEQQNVMQLKSQGSPRYIKNFYGNMYALDSCGTYSFEKCLDQTYQDLYGND